MALTILTRYFSIHHRRFATPGRRRVTPAENHDGTPILEVGKAINQYLTFGYGFSPEEIDLISINLLSDSGDKLFTEIFGGGIEPPVIEMVYPEKATLTLADGTKLLERIPGSFIKVDHGDGPSIYKVGN